MNKVDNPRLCSGKVIDAKTKPNVNCAAVDIIRYQNGLSFLLSTTNRHATIFAFRMARSMFIAPRSHRMSIAHVVRNEEIGHLVESVWHGFGSFDGNAATPHNLIIVFVLSVLCGHFVGHIDGRP